MGWNLRGLLLTGLLLGSALPTSAQQNTFDKMPVSPTQLPTPDPVSPVDVQPVAPPVLGTPQPTPRQGNLPPPVPKGELQAPTVIPIPNATKRRILIAPRSATPYQWTIQNRDGEDIVLLTGGIKFLAIFTENGGSTLDIEADQLVMWSKDGAKELFGAAREQGGTEQNNDRKVELFLSGNVVIRFGSNKPNARANQVQDGTMRAERVYFDVSNNKALALNAELEFVKPDLGVPAIIKANEIQQLSREEFNTIGTGLSASRLPSDPGLEVTVAEATILQRKQLKRTIFGIPFINRTTGDDIEQVQRTYEGRNAKLRIGGVPIFYLPYLSGNVNDPLGPLQSVGFRQDRVFGTQLLTSFDVLELIGVTKLPGERWSLYADYLSRRGPALGTEYNISGQKLFGIESNYRTNVRLYGINDHDTDILGGPRENDFVPDDYRGRAFFQHYQEIDNLTLQAQVSYLSDPRFFEQYYKYEFDSGPNQETFLHAKYQEGIYTGTILGEVNFFRNFVTETEWLPKVSGHMLGRSFFDRLTYNAWGSVGYARLRPTEEPPFAVQTTDQRIETGRIDVMQELSAPFSLGAFRLAPYGKVDLAGYTNDLTGDPRGRYVAGGGVRGSIPFSKLYQGVDSELFNLHGLNHKIVLAGNYYSAYSNTPYFLLPQLDRLNDDALDQTLRVQTPFQTTFVPFPAGQLLQTSPVFNPQLYAIRRLVDTRADTLDTIQVVQADLRQRFQTKRGYPGMEHTVDWLSFDLSASYFPAENRDNFGKPISFIEYDTAWYVGDQTALTSAGWFDPFDPSTRYFNIGGFLNRPDRTSFYLGYRQTDPLGSKAVNGSIGYVFSPKYSMTASTSYDFGTSITQSSALFFTRTGTDLSVSVGLTYNSIVKNFGIGFEIVPNLLAARSGSGLLGGLTGNNPAGPYGQRR